MTARGRRVAREADSRGRVLSGSFSCVSPWCFVVFCLVLCFGLGCCGCGGVLMFIVYPALHPLYTYSLPTPPQPTTETGAATAGLAQGKAQAGALHGVGLYAVCVRAFACVWQWCFGGLEEVGVWVVLFNMWGRAWPTHGMFLLRVGPRCCVRAHLL